MKKSQRERVIGVLKSQGYVSRNHALRNFISRLSAIIQDLEAEGWEFAPRREGGDYEYHVKKIPTHLVSKVIEVNGKFIETKVSVTI